jgi:membrane-bound lytic murein transglycosylase F
VTLSIPAHAVFVTEDTAERMGVSDRKDAAQSIRGGTDYFRELTEKFPDRIVGDDRIAFTLAAYNIGFRHLEDARLLTARRGGNKDAWKDVKKQLPSLRDPLVYATLRYGYARGDEAVDFVESVNRYHDALRWLDAVDDDTLARRMAGKALPGFHHEVAELVSGVATTALSDD